MTDARQHVLVIYGGRSVEHEISCRSAAFVLRHLDPEKYIIHAIAIAKDGRWLPQRAQSLLAELGGSVPIKSAIADQGAPLVKAQDPGSHIMALIPKDDGKDSATKNNLVVFPVLHGTFGEDGTLQGLFELAEIAYVGPDHLGSAIGIDKVVAKKLAQTAGVPVVPWIDARRQDWDERKDDIVAEVERTLGFPVFVKPARLGSSVGIIRVASRDKLEAACDGAFQFDDKILVEKALNVREIECAALGDYDPLVSIPGEIMAHAEFYTYEAKYIDAKGASITIPAQLESDQIHEVQNLTKKVFRALDLYGMARIDLFLEKVTGKLYFNEVNTIPGFTEISQYPLLWKESGVSPKELIDRLITLAVKRHETKAQLKRTR